jgi:hypothetical protein
VCQALFGEVAAKDLAMVAPGGFWVLSVGTNFLPFYVESVVDTFICVPHRVESDYGVRNFLVLSPVVGVFDPVYCHDQCWVDMGALFDITEDRGVRSV